MYYFIHILDIPPPTHITTSLPHSLTLTPSLPHSLTPSLPHTLSPSQVLQEIVENGIKIYSFPDTEGDEEEAVANRKLRVSPSNYHHHTMYHY